MLPGPTLSPDHPTVLLGTLMLFCNSTPKGVFAVCNTSISSPNERVSCELSCLTQHIPLRREQEDIPVLP